jgi:hypothetical protein
MRWIRKIFLVAFSFMILSYAYSLEYTGFKLGYMNVKGTNLYGIGIFTSDKRFDAEMSFYFGERFYRAILEDNYYDESEHNGMSFTDYHKFYEGVFVAFSGSFHFIRSPRMSVYIGGGLLPPIPIFARYLYFYHIGVSIYQSAKFRIDFEFKQIFARNPTKDYSRINATDNPGQRENELISFSFAEGPAILVSLKFALWD